MTHLTQRSARTQPGPKDLDRLELLTLGLTALAALLGWGLLGGGVGIGATAGGVVATANLRLLRVVVGTLSGRAASGEMTSGSRKALLAALILFKFIGFYGGLWLLLSRTELSPLGFLLGFSSLFPAVLCYNLLGPSAAARNAAIGERTSG